MSIETAAQMLGVKVEATRRTPIPKQWLLERVQQYQEMETYTGESYDPLRLDFPPPVPLAENLWGDRWRFTALPAGNIRGYSGSPNSYFDLILFYVS